MTALAARVPFLARFQQEPILVNGEQIKYRWLQNLLWSVVGAVVGAWMISALYYLILEVHWTFNGHTLFWLKHTWDHALTQSWWPYARHDLRNVYEAVFATLFIRSIITKRKQWEKKVGVVRLATAPFVIFLAALPVVALGIYIVDVHNFSVPGSISNYQAYLIGFVAAQVVHRVYAPIGSTVQGFFIEQRVAKGKRPHWPLPPVMRERYQWTLDRQKKQLVDSYLKTGHAETDSQAHPVLYRTLVWGMTVVLFALAAYGGFVRFWIATGHVTPGHLF